MSIHLTFTPDKNLPPRGKVKTPADKVHADKVMGFLGLSVQDGGAGGFKDKLIAREKAGTNKNNTALKRKNNKAPYGAVTSHHSDGKAQAGLDLHQKNIVALPEKFDLHGGGALNGNVNAHGAGKTLLMKSPVIHVGEGFAMGRRGNGQSKVSGKAPLSLKSTPDGPDLPGKVGRGEEGVSKGMHKRPSSPRKELKGAVVQAGKGGKNAPESAIPGVRHPDTPLERALQSSVNSLQNLSSMNKIALKAPVTSMITTIMNPLKGAEPGGVLKKHVPAVKASRGNKKRRSVATGIRTKALKGAYTSGTALPKGASMLFIETVKGSAGGIGRENIAFGEAPASTAAADAAPQGVPGFLLPKGDSNAVFKDPSALFNMNAPIGRETAQTVGGAFTTDVKNVLAGKEGELIQKASDGVVMSLRQADKEIRISLKPEELGHLEIKVKVHHGLVEASILVDNKDVMNMLNANNASLKEQLARQGLMLGGLEVALKHGGGSTQNRRDLRGGNGGRYGRGTGAVRGAATEDEVIPMAAKAHHETKAQGALDLFI